MDFVKFPTSFLCVLQNRQNSISTDNTELQTEWEQKQQEVIDKAKEVYCWAIEKGIAKEQARCVLPEGNTQSRLYINGIVTGKQIGRAHV